LFGLVATGPSLTQENLPILESSSDNLFSGSIRRQKLVKPMSAKEGTKSGVAPDERVAIGLTFGNSYSSIACTVDDAPVVIANEDGDRQIPTVLSYVDGEEYTGGQAKAFLIRNANNTVVSFRDFLGQECVDPAFEGFAQTFAVVLS
jgi:molecular chaperone DnaK (HSP70)